MSAREIIGLIFTFIVIISLRVHGYLQITEHEYTLMHYTKLISEQHSTDGRPLVIVLPLSEEDSTNKEVGYLIEDLHTSGRWSIMVYNVSYKMNGNMYTEIHQQGNYIILISGLCKDWEDPISRFWQQMYNMLVGNYRMHSWNPKDNFVVSVMSNCLNVENTKFSRAILNELWLEEVMNAAALFLKSNKQTGNDLQQNTRNSAQDMYLELHTWYPYENSERCNPIEGNVPVKVFKAQNFSDIRKSEILREYLNKNIHKCRITVHAYFGLPFVNLSKSVWYNYSENQHVYQDGWEIELLNIIGKSINVSLDIIVGNEKEYRKDLPTVYAGGHATISS